MSTICFVTFEIHPTTKGGCGVLLHHAASHLLEQGHEVVFGLDMPPKQFLAFRDRDRLSLPNPENCRVLHWRELCAGCPLSAADVPLPNQLRGARYLHAYRELLRREPTIDMIEFIEYCGVGYYPFLARVFGIEPEGVNKPVCTVRLHNPIELIDHFSPSDKVNEDRYIMYALERAGIGFAENVLTPTKSYHAEYFRDQYALPDSAVTVSQSPKLPFPRVKRRPSKRERFSITFVGRMWHFKGVDQLVHAACVLMDRRPELDFTVELIGPDSNESPHHDSFVGYLKTLMPEGLRDRFVFTGNLTHDEVAERLDRALFAVFPNHFESFCYAMHEVYDAGVPIVATELPGFADFFEHEKNCLYYDGTARDLIAAMERLIDDDGLRESLCRPYPVADNPLGGVYADPTRLTPLVDADGVDEDARTLVVILCRSSRAEAKPTIDAMLEQTNRAFETVVLEPADPDAGETLWLLGGAWRAFDASGARIAPHDITTLDAITILRAGDRPHAMWHGACLGALGRRSSLAFAGTWRFRNGRAEPIDIDLSPETAPFSDTVPRPRVLTRTDRGRLLGDLFDLSLGHLGEIGHIWSSIARHGRGAVLPEPMLDAADDGAEAPDPYLTHYLLNRYGGPFEDRLKIYAGVLRQRIRRLASAGERRAAPVEPVPTAHMDVEQKIHAASTLGGRTLVRISLEKLVRRIRPGRQATK